MAWPSVVTTFTNPNPTDRLSTTPHSSIETAQNTDLTALETFIGTEASTVGTLFYDIRAAASSGGGHVQTANKGGTGQTAYTKGDILVATSSSVLTKLAVSANDNDQLVVDASVASGVKWTAGVTSGQVQNQAFSWAGKDSGSGSVYAIYPTPCVLSYADGQLFGFRAATANTITNPALSVSSLVSKLIKNADGTAIAVGQIPASTITVVQYNAAQSVFGLVSTSSPTNFSGAFGAWSDVTGNADSAPHQVTTDGFLVGIVTGNNAGAASTRIWTDGNNPPTTLRMQVDNRDPNYTQVSPFNLPVRKNDYYMTSVVSATMTKMFWLPLGI